MVSEKEKKASFLDLLKDEDFHLFVRIFKAHFPQQKYRFALSFLLIVITSVTVASTVWIVKDVVDKLLVQKDFAILGPILVLIIVTFLVKGASTYWSSILGVKIANDIVADTQRTVFQHILTQRVTFFERYTSDDLNVRVNQGAAAFSNILNRVIIGGARDAGAVIAAFYMMIVQDPVLTLISFTAVPVIFGAVAMILKRIKNLMQQEILSIAQLNKHVRETTQGSKVIKAYNLEPIIQSEVNDVIEKIKDRANRLAFLENAPVPIVDALAGIGVGLAIVYAGYRAAHGDYTPGQLSAFIIALVSALDPMRRLSQLRIVLKTSLVGVSMVHELLDYNEPDHTPASAAGFITEIPAPKDQGLRIDMQDVAFSYTGKSNVLEGFSLAIDAGEMVAFVGPSGAGKSTVFSLLLRFHHHNAGKIFIAGEDIETIPVTLLRDRIAYVGQANFIFSGTVRENLTLRRADVPEAALIEACQTVGLHDYISSLPNGYDTYVGELGSLISGGQAQRLNIARAIIKDAPILLFDEVTSALDAENEELIRSYMHAQVGRKTILVIAHRLSTIRQANKIALIEGGQVRAFGTHQDLLVGNEYYEKVATLQLIA